MEVPGLRGVAGDSAGPATAVLVDGVGGFCVEFEQYLESRQDFTVVGVAGVVPTHCGQHVKTALLGSQSGEESTREGRVRG